MSIENWTSGLELDLDYMLPGRPNDPEMRESASIWLYEENGDFGFPRIGIEAKGSSWDEHGVQMNFVDRHGRALRDGGKRPTLPSLGADGKHSILGAEGLKFECIEPFRRWRVSYDGTPVETSSEALVAGAINSERRTRLKFEVDIVMATPGWAQDLRPERLADMTEAERIDAGLMGYGWRVEHTFRAEGTLTLDGQTRSFKGVGDRIHRQSVRPMGAFRGHCWQSALFPDGRAFAICVYPPREDGTTYNDGYIYSGGKLHPAKATKIPFITKLIASGEDVSVEIESDLGISRITGVSAFNVFHRGMAEMPGFILHQGGAKYTWDGQTAYGMIERSNREEFFEKS